MQYKIERRGQRQFITGSGELAIAAVTSVLSYMQHGIAGQWAQDMEKGSVLHTISLYYQTHSVNREEIQFFNQHVEYHIN